MIIPKDTKHIEIIGTHVVPEFGVFSIAIMAISFIGIAYARKFNLGLWTRIN
jgi:predicted secreted protein with PEFG-CTERM motif